MRSDYLGDCAQFQDLPEAINEGQYLIPRLTREQLRSAITGPVAVGGGQIEPQLVTQLLNDIGDKQDQLPILQHALMRTWDEWLKESETDGESNGPNNGFGSFRSIGLNHYEKVGGLANALSKHANEVFKEVVRLVGSRGGLIVERMFKSLTEKDPEGRGIRRPVKFTDLCAVVRTNDSDVTEDDKKELTTIINCFRAEGRSFLMPPISPNPDEQILDDESVIDISHESLIRNWKGSDQENRLHEWIDEESQSARIYRRLYETAILQDGEKEELLSGVSLTSAQDWQTQQKPTVAWAKRYHSHADLQAKFPEEDADEADKKLLNLTLNFLTESDRKEQLDAEAQERFKLKELKLEAERKWAVRLRWLSAALFVALIFAGWATRYAFSQSRAAEINESKAKKESARARTSESEAITSKNEAEKQKGIAEEQTREAEKQKGIAEKEKDEAKKQQRLAEAAKKDAVEQRQVAENNRVRAESQASIATNSEKEARKLQELTEKQNEQLIEKNGQLLQGTYISELNQAFDLSYTNPERATEILELYKKDQEKTGLRDFYWYYLWSLTHPTLKQDDYIPIPPQVRSTTHNSVYGNLIATQNSGAVQIWDVRKKELVSLLVGYSLSGVWNSFSPDNKILAVSRNDNRKLNLLDTNDGKPLPELQDLTDNILTWEFSPDSSLLVAYSGEAYPTTPLGIWRVGTGEKLFLFAEIQQSKTSRVIFSPDSKTLALEDDKGKVSLKEIYKNDLPKLVDSRESETPQYRSIQFSKDGSMLVVENKGLWNQSITDSKYASRIYSTDTLKLLYEFKNGEFFRQFTPDGRILISQPAKQKRKASAKTDPFDAPEDQAVLLDVKSCKSPLDAKSCRSTEVPNLVFGIWDTATIGMTDDGRFLLYQNGEHLNALDLSTGKLLYQEKNRYSQYQFSPSGKEVLVAIYEPVNTRQDSPARSGISEEPIQKQKTNSAVKDVKTAVQGAPSKSGPSEELVQKWKVGVAVMDIKTAVIKRVVRSDFTNDLDFSIAQFVFSQDGKEIVRLSSSITRWNANSGELIDSFDVPKERIYSLVFFPDGQKLLTGQKDGTVTIRLADKQNSSSYLSQIIKGVIGHKQEVLSVAISPDGKILASSDKEGLVKLWDENLQPLTVQLSSEHKQAVNSLAFSLDNQILATASDDQTVRIWDLKTGKMLGTLKHEAAVMSLSFSSKGNLLATGDQNGNLRLWDVLSGELRKTRRAHEGSILALAFSVDQSKIASAGEGKDKGTVTERDGTKIKQVEDTAIKLWDLSLEECGKLEGHSDSVLSISFSPDGKSLASGSRDGTIRLWNLVLNRQVVRLGDFRPQFQLEPNTTFLFPLTAFSPDPNSQKLAYSSGEMIVILIAATEKEINQPAQSPQEKQLINR